MFILLSLQECNSFHKSIVIPLFQYLFLSILIFYPMIVGINGYGRIGKEIYRILVQKNIKVAAVNDPFIDIKYFHYTAKYDSVYGILKDVQLKENSIEYNGIETVLLNEKDPSKIDWQKYKVDYVVECTGIFKTQEQCSMHNAKRVILTCPSNDLPTFVLGVNHNKIGNEKVISNASCTTNCLAPLAKIVNDNFGIEEGFLSTIHAMTATQKTVDGKGSSWRSNRSCMNIIPASTGAAIATEKVIPELKGKIGAMSYRVPVASVSVIDLVVKLNKPASIEDIKNLIVNSQDPMVKKVLGYTEDEVVSSDFIGDSRSSILDINASKQLSPTFIKLVSWYDNEFGYSCRVVDLLQFLAVKDGIKN